MSELDPVPTLHTSREPWLPAREEVRERLLAQAHLFEDPGTYRAGVLDAFAALEDDLG